MKVILAITLLMVVSCKPTDKVVESQNMRVISAKERNGSVRGVPQSIDGKYEYIITDKSDLNWVFVTDQKFNVGDRVVITAEK